MSYPIFLEQRDAQQRPRVPGVRTTGGDWRKSVQTDAIDGAIYDPVCFEVEWS